MLLRRRSNQQGRGALEPAPPQPRFSVIIPVLNEACNIRACLESVSCAEHVFVVDSHSTDGTCEIAEELGATVVQFDYDGGWPKKKNWAIRNLPVDTDWILILDADERVTPELRAEIEEALRRDDVDGFYVRWKFVFLGRWMKHAWSHGWMLRLFRKGTGEYEDLGMRDEGGWDNEVHENIVVTGETACLSSLLLHESKQDLKHWLAKQNEFSTWNAVRRRKQLQEPIPPLSSLLSADPLKRRRFLKAVFLRLPAKPVAIFVYLYFVRLGFLDGIPGLYFCALRAMHELTTCAKVHELQENRSHKS